MAGVPKVSPSEKFVIEHRNRCRTPIARTAVAADMEQQTRAAYIVKYYSNEDRQCVACDRPFIFSAGAEILVCDVLGFGRETEGKRCVDCRQAQHALRAGNQRFSELSHTENRSQSQAFERTAIYLHQLEAGLFHPRQAQTVRHLINQLERM